MLNLPRVRLSRAVAFLQAHRFMKMSQLPVEVFDALAMSFEEAESLQAAHNEKALIAEAMRAARGRGGYSGGF